MQKVWGNTKKRRQMARGLDAEVILKTKKKTNEKKHIVQNCHFD